MKNKATWASLTAKEKKHLSVVAGVTTLKAFRETAEHQRRSRSVQGSPEPCWECRLIASKLGLPV